MLAGCKAAVCPCVLYGETYERAEQGSAAWACCAYACCAGLSLCCLPARTRGRLQAHAGYAKRHCLLNWVVHAFCGPCALAQEARAVVEAGDLDAAVERRMKAAQASVGRGAGRAALDTSGGLGAEAGGGGVPAWAR